MPKAYQLDDQLKPIIKETGSQPAIFNQNLNYHQLSEDSLWSILIGRGRESRKSRVLAHKLIPLIDQAEKYRRTADFDNLNGINYQSLQNIQAAAELIRRSQQIGSREPIDGPAAVAARLYNYADRHQEHLITLSLNSSNQIIRLRVTTIGLVNFSLVHPREVFAPAIGDRAVAVIIAHNHPSGQLKPSEDDISVTRRLKMAGEILGVKLLDHVIFTTNGHYSFQENRMF